jgi:hypothetical protein
MTWKGYLLLGALVVPLALAARWTGNATQKGARFSPAPDTVEYAAEAQALARTGQVFLQIGPYRVRPRFPPGWPLLIAPGVRLGMEGRDLWKITPIYGALLAWLIGAAAAAATGALGEWGSEGSLRRGAPWLPPLIAGLLAGSVWAVAPLAIDVGNTLLSDEPTALICLAGLSFGGLAFLGREGRGGWALALIGGLAFGLAATMRSIVAVLMLAPLAFFLMGGLRRIGWRAVLRRALPWALGAAVFPAVTVLILARSGWPVWQWSGYGFWMPGRFDHLSSTFNLQSAFQPDLTFRQEERPLSHFELALKVLSGWPGLRPSHYLGFLWPLAGWLATVPLYRIARRRDSQLTAWIAPALLLWTLAHVAVFSLYFYPSPRFYLAPLALSLALLATECGVMLSRPDRMSRFGGAALVAGTVFLGARSFIELRNEPPPNVDTERTRAHFNRWLEIGDERRSRRTMPYDPVYAQALGLLTPEVAAEVKAWGELPDTVQVRRLRANGFLAAHQGAPPPVR